MECQEFMAEVSFLELPPETLVTAGFQFALHIHTILEEAEIVAILSKEVFNHETSKVEL